MLRGLVIQILPDGKRRGWSGRDLEWINKGVKETEGEVKEDGKRSEGGGEERREERLQGAREVLI